MRTHQFLLFTGFAALASAGLDQRDLSDCTDAASDFVSDFNAKPTPPSSLAKFVDNQVKATYTDECIIPSVTGSLASEYTSFMSEFSTWYMDYASAYSSVVDACKDVPEVTSELATVTDTICAKIKWEDATGSDNAAPRETGMAIAAAAVAGFVVAGVV